MERPIFKPLGTPVEQLDTPALVVDLDALDNNIKTVHSFFLNTEAKLRPDVGSHRCPAIAHKQVGAGGTVGGVSVATVGQAECFCQFGLTDVFIANEVVGTQKISRLCALARCNKMTVAADSAAAVQDISQGCKASGVTVNVVVDINTGLDRCGVEPGQPAVDLATAIARSDNLNFAGLMACEGPALGEDKDQNAAESRKRIQQVLDTRELVEKQGLKVEIVSVGGTHNYDVAGSMAGVTEVPAGSYALMDYRYARHQSQLKVAARVMTTVTSRPESGTAITDSGQKAMGPDTGLPVVDGIEGATPTRMSAEHAILTLEGNAQGRLAPGDKVWLIPWDIGGCINVYDYMNLVQGGKLVGVWDISARGRYR